IRPGCRPVSHRGTPRTAGWFAVLVNNNLHLFLPLQALSVYRVIFPGLDPKEWKNLSVKILSGTAGIQHIRLTFAAVQPILVDRETPYSGVLSTPSKFRRTFFFPGAIYKRGYEMKAKELRIKSHRQQTQNGLVSGRERSLRRLCHLVPILFFFILHPSFCLRGFGQGTAFTYQGQLNLNGAPANGNYDFQFILFNTNQFGFPAGPILTNANISVNNGLFTTALDFGSVFTGSNYWLDVSVRTNGNGAFTDLSPRQPIAPAPYAMAAATLTSVVENNTIQGGLSSRTIGGGPGNVIQDGASIATAGGDEANVIQTGADHST